MKVLLSPKVQWLLIIILSLAAIRSCFAIWRLWKAGRIVGETESQLLKLKNDQQQLQAKLAEVQSPEFVEREARDKLGFGKEGETIIVLPKQDEIVNVQYSMSNEKEPNWKQWRKLYLGF